MDIFLPADGRDISAGKRSAATLRASGRGRAQRESEEQIPRQPEAGSCRDDRQEEPPHAIGVTQIYSTHVSSKFPANSLKTNDGCPYKPQQKTRPVRPGRFCGTRPVHADIFCGTGGSISARCRAEGRGATFNSPSREGATHRPMAPNYSTHVPSKFRPNSLKTNNWCTYKVTHNSQRDVRLLGRGGTGPEQGRGNPAMSNAVASSPFAPLRPPIPSAVEGREFPASLATRHLPLATNHSQETARLPRPHPKGDCKPRRRPRPSLLSSAEALRIIFRCMIVVLYKRNFFEPGEPRWALLFSGPKTIHTSQSSKAFRREND